MRFRVLIRRLAKIGLAVTSFFQLRALTKFGVLAAVEHRSVLTVNLRTVIDIGANRGQFSLAVLRWAPNANVIAFEPLPEPAAIFDSVFRSHPRFVLHRKAISATEGEATIHVSRRDDSSSLLPMGPLQEQYFAGTAEVSQLEVSTVRLDSVIAESEIVRPAMLKIDVQGFEFEVLQGTNELLIFFDQIYVECSFIELYREQKLVSSVIEWLFARGFVLVGVYNIACGARGECIQADFLFGRA